MTFRRSLGVVGALALGFSGCAAEAGERGTVRVTAYGEELIEQGIMARDLADGWAVSFASFRVSVRDVQLGSLSFSGPFAVDLVEPSRGDGQVLETGTLPVGTYTGPGFTLEWVHVIGSAEKDGQVKTFDWVFEEPTRYVDCETTTEVTVDGESTLQLTVHADHLFYDSLVSSEPELRFQAIADADFNNDGQVTGDELWSKGLGDYDPGSAGGIDTLWDFIVAQVGSLGHVDGEAHCTVDSQAR